MRVAAVVQWFLLAVRKGQLVRAVSRFLAELKLKSLGFVGRRNSRRRTGARVRFVGLSKALFQFGETVNSVVVPRPYGRFGNQFFQLRNGLALAERLQATSLEAVGFDANIAEPDVNEGPGPRVIFREPSYSKGYGPGGVKRSGPDGLRLLLNPYFLLEEGELAVPMTSSELDRASAELRSLLEIPRPAALGENCLVIHLRAGDVFDSNPHGAYGQPPIGFYELVMLSSNWERVLVVRQDDSHPLEHAIQQLAQDRQIEIEFRSGSFSEDLSVLLSAQFLVASRGTLIPAVACLSECLKRVFAFGPSLSEPASPENLLGPDFGYPSKLDVQWVRDHGDSYWSRVCNENWANHPGQIDLMKTYGAENMVARFPE